MLHPCAAPLLPLYCPFAVLQEADRLFLVMEYCAGGDLAHLLRAVKRLPEPAAQHLMRQLAAGLRQMWAHHLVHVSGCCLLCHRCSLVGCRGQHSGVEGLAHGC